MILCDLCSRAKECLQKEIEGKEYDICSECWIPLAERLKGKGRPKKEREILFLPTVTPEPKREEPKPVPENRRRPGVVWAGHSNSIRRQLHQEEQFVGLLECL
jgi:hypothetical protein